jgi:NAD(P)-dependent dehydrogenase (short-subunit alcohol dehydrogenase family)
MRCKEANVTMRLKDKVAIITGGGRGIGRAIAEAFAAEGASVAVAARNISSLEETVERIRATGGQALEIGTDVSKETDIKRMVAETLDAFGRIDVLVNNSGITGPTSTVADMKLDEWNETLAVNLTGAMLCSREVLAHMIPRKSGVVVNITSEGGRGCDGRAGFPRRAAYCCSKIGMIGLTETTAVEVGEYGIRVNAISPAGVKGERIMNIFRGRAQTLGISAEDLIDQVTVANYSLRRMAEEAEVASAALFLASEESSAITGQVIVVNCGHHILH